MRFSSQVVRFRFGRYADGEKVADQLLRLHVNLDGCRTQYVGAANDNCSPAAQVGLPALNLEMVRAIDFKNHSTPILKLPFCVEVADPTLSISSLDLSVGLFEAEATTEAYKINLTQRLRPAANVAERFTRVT